MLAKISVFSVLAILVSGWGITKPVIAQPITPAIDGTGTIVSPTNNQFNVTGGTVSRDGTNLFHSFQQFGLDPSQSAIFLSNPNIQNIFGRVTGGSPSVINGLVQVTGGSSNLFLMNPAGIVFGSNASLNVPASFAATTATSIGFGNQWFNAIGSNDYNNLIGSPTSFAFAVLQPGAIVNAGNLAVLQGQNLALLGGTVVNTGLLSAPGGQITVSAVPGENLIRLNQPGSLLSLELVPLSPTNSSTLSPPSLPQLLTGGNLSNATGLAADSSGQIRLTSSQALIPGNVGSTAISGQIDTSGQVGGSVQVLGDRVGLFGTTINASGIDHGGTVLIGGDYKGQGTVPNASRTYVSPDSSINASSMLSGNGGRVIVWADGATGFYGTINASGGSQAGNGGFAEVSGKQNLVFDGTANLSAVSGQTGTLLLDPTNIVISNVASTPSVVDGALPDILQNEFPGQTITISEAVLEGLLGNQDLILEATNNFTIGTLTETRTDGALSGNVLRFPGTGNVTLRADADGDGVGTFSMNLNDFIETPSGVGDVGRTLTISGADINVGAIVTRSGNGSEGPRPGGNVVLTATGNISTGLIATFSDSSPPTFNPPNFGRGGDISITSTQGSIDTSRGALAAGASQGNAGTVRLQARGDIVTSNISVSPTTSDGLAGNITIISTGGNIDTSKQGLGAFGTLESGLSAGFVARQGGTIRLEAFGNITTGNIGGGGVETGATINLISQTGSIDTTLGRVNSGVLSESPSLVLSNQSGSVSITAAGNIRTGTIRTDGQSIAGDISLNSTFGSIDTIAGTLSATSVTGGNGGNITLNAPVGNIQVNRIDTFALGQSPGLNAGAGGNIRLSGVNITATGQLNAFSESDFASSANSGSIILQANGGTINTELINAFSNAGRLGGIGNAGNGGTVALTATGAVQTGNIFAFSNAPAGSATDAGRVQLLSETGNITTGDIQAFSVSAASATATGSGAAIALVSPNGGINAGDLDTRGTIEGGSVDILARTQITAGVIDTSATVGNGGNVFLDPLGDIQVTSINAQGGTSGRGGNVEAITQSYFRATGGFNDRNNLFTSISTAGGLGGGDITIRHGGQGIIPFRIGDASLNGTLGALSTGLDNIIAVGNLYYFTYTQPGSSGTMRIISVDPPNSPLDRDRLEPLDKRIPQPCDILNDIVCRLEEYFTRQYDRFFQRSNTPIKSLAQIQQELRRIEQATGVKPALIYAFFTPGGSRSTDVTNQVKSLTPNQTAQGILWSYPSEETTSGQAPLQIGCPSEIKDQQPVGQTSGDRCHLELVLVTSDINPIIRRVPDSPQSEVLGNANLFSSQVRDNDGGSRIYARKFYDWLITPLKADLKNYGVDNLVFVLDKGLRTLPLSALRQERFLLDDYSVGMMPSMSATDTQYVSVKKAAPLLMGVSRFSTKQPLPAVPLELNLLRTLNSDSLLFLDSAVTKDTLVAQRQNFQLIHLATHGSFQPKDPINSYILLSGDEKLSLDEIKQFGWKNPLVELLVLSACETAKGNGETEYGFAGSAIQAGVKTSLASLWVVPDGETVPLMVEFYSQLQQSSIKAEALRRAQNLIRQNQWQVRLEGLLRELKTTSVLPPTTQTLIDNLLEKNLESPYYWASFTMIGNPW